jgi:hypothetical protein
MQCEIIEFQNFYRVFNFESKTLFGLPFEAQASREL